jgi:hypothetical protein
MKKINLHIPIWDSQNEERNNEIIDSFQKNINLKIFNYFYVYLENDNGKKILNEIKNNNIIEVILNKRPTYQDIFDTSNIISNESINILINSDIFFDETIKLVQNIKDDEFYAITRYELNGNLFWIIQDNISKDFPYSQDCWVWCNSAKFKNSNFYLGQPGCDNKIVNEAYIAGYKIKNPCYDIKTYHNHASNIRNGTSHSNNYNTEIHLKPKMYVKCGKIHELKELGLMDETEKGLCSVIEQKN